MAEEKKIPEKQGWFKKLINWFVNLPGRIAKAFKNMFAELRKVTWPSKKKLISSCIIVILFMVFTGAIVSLLDMGSAAAVNGLYRLTHPSVAFTIEEGTVPAGTEEGTVPAGTEDGATEPAATEDGATEPAATEDGATEPAATEDGATEPAATEDGATEPAATEDGATEPAATEDGATEPAAE